MQKMITAALLGLSMCAVGCRTSSITAATTPSEKLAKDKSGGDRELPDAPVAVTQLGRYPIGISLDDVHSSCKERGKFMKSGDAYACFYAKERDSGSLADFRFCDGALCSVNTFLFLRTASAQAWVDAFDEVLSALKDRLGAPNMPTEQVLPKECKTAFYSCLQDGRAKVIVGWGYKTHVVFARMGSTGEGVPAISIYVATMQGTKWLKKDRSAPYTEVPDR